MKKIIRSFALFALVALPLAAQAETEQFVIDKNHSSATFKVRHMMANVMGQFRDLSGTVNVDRENPAKSSVEFTIQAASIDTGNQNRDEHLRSPDFFDAAKFPTITFKSTGVAAKGGNLYDVTGDLTLHGVTKRIVLPVQFLGFGKTARGEKAGFTIETTLQRKDYGILWNRNLDEGGVLLGDDVRVTIELEVDKKVPAAAAAK
ncbi:MAG TPA: YceI family protein [Thermoanaerobaculia bacterium]|nr:YceI family protein [Thermoanaerobaculia bacterium]